MSFWFALIYPVTLETVDMWTLSDHKDDSSPANWQVRKGGLPPLARTCSCRGPMESVPPRGSGWVLTVIDRAAVPGRGQILSALIQLLQILHIRHSSNCERNPPAT